jgi:hypothetical protein
MARTITEIYNALLTSKTQQPELAQLNSTSSSAIYNLIYYTCAIAINLLEQIFDTFKIDVDKIRKDSIAGTSNWWVYKMQQFQFAPNNPDEGVLTIGEDLIPKYLVENGAKKIIKFVSLKASTKQQVNIKVAKDNGNGEPAQLTNDELKAAQYYVQTIQPVGLFINTISFPADKLSGTIDVYYNGLYVETVVKNNIQLAIKEYLQNLTFDGTIYLTSLVDAIQKVTGVENVVVVSIFGGGDGDTPQEFLTPETQQRYTTKAGYCIVDNTGLILNLKLNN